MTNTARNHRDNVFCMLYRDRGNLLSLYNAVNGTDYQDEGELEVVTLESAICVSMRNDAAFLIDSGLNLYEQQSTVNENMPLRDLYYVAEELKRLVPATRLYRRSGVRMPSPRFVVFYNGPEEQPQERVFRLSELYGNGTGEPELELKVRQININRGCSEGILGKCESLKGYMAFVEKVREKTASGMKAEDAVTEAVDECIREGVLAEFFTEHKSEVIEMGIFEYDAELHEQAIKEESWMEGKAEGILEGKAEGILEGKAEGRVEGKAEGKAEDILELLEDLEPVPEELREEILSQRDMDILKSWFKAAARADSLEEWKRGCFL